MRVFTYTVLFLVACFIASIPFVAYGAQKRLCITDAHGETCTKAPMSAVDCNHARIRALGLQPTTTEVDANTHMLIERRMRFGDGVRGGSTDSTRGVVMKAECR
jgi:hypothetical protein